jgi:hypothetical protein
MAQRAKLQLHPHHPAGRAAHAPAPRQTATTGSARPKAREGTRLVGAHVPVSTWRELHALRGELGVTMQALVVEALEDLVAKHRKR